uniref:Sorcin n=1 Tax=Oreochromis niloticus TaxID=8128 RepID=A0A669C0B4_ORENI
MSSPYQSELNVVARTEESGHLPLRGFTVLFTEVVLFISGIRWLFPDTALAPVDFQECNKILSMVIFQLLRVRMDRSQQMSCSAASRNLASLAHTNRDLSCTMGFNEFKDLWQALNGWRGTFASFDRDQSGTIEGHELQQAINSMGYNLSPQAMNCIMKRYSLNGRIPFDEFVSCAVRLRALTDHFRRRDTTQTGNASFQYDDVSFHS